MNLETKRTSFRSALLRLDEVTCHRAHRGLSCEECKTNHEIGIPLSGVNVRHIGGKTYTVTPSQITLSNRGEAYQVSHPYGSGETMLQIALREDVLLDILRAHDPGTGDRPKQPFRDRQVPAEAKLHFAVQLLLAGATSAARSDMELEETAIALIERITSNIPGSKTNPRSNARDLDVAHQARATLAAHFAQPIALADIAASIGVSIYHLCRVFRRVTGLTLWREVQQLRVRAALARLAAGERDLTALGLALGYANHSHFTAGFRQQLGITPSAARQRFATGSLAEARALLAC